MRGLGHAIVAAVALSLVPAAPPVLAASYVPNGAVFAAADGSIVEVGHRGKKYSKKYSKRHKKYRHGCRGCRSRHYARGYRHGYPYAYGYRHRNFGGCFGYNGFWVCF